MSLFGRPQRRDQMLTDLEGFMARAMKEGNLDDYSKAFQAHDKRRQAIAPPPPTSGSSSSSSSSSSGSDDDWIGGVIFALFMIVFVLWIVATILQGIYLWMLAHPVWAALIIAGIIAALGLGGYLWLVGRRRPRRRVVKGTVRPQRPTAPPDIRRIPVAEPVKAPAHTRLSPDELAMFRGLGTAKGTAYVEALEAGAVMPPSRSVRGNVEVFRAELPRGEVLARNVDVEAFADVLDIPKERVLVQKEPGAFVARILAHDPGDQYVGPWAPLGQPTSWTRPMPLGVDVEGEPVHVQLAQKRVIVGGTTGCGKTYTMRLFAMYAAADPDVDLVVLDFKGAPELACLEPYAIEFYSAARLDPKQVIASLNRVRDEMWNRYDSGKSGTARPMLVLIDESWKLRDIPGAQAILENIAREGRQSSVGFVIGLQDAAKKTLDNSITGQADIRICMATSDPATANIITEHYPSAQLAPTFRQGEAFVKVRGQMEPVRMMIHKVKDAAAQSHLLRCTPAAPIVVQPATAGNENAQDDEHVCGHTSCGRPIPARQKYCSNACKTAAYRARQAASGA